MGLWIIQQCKYRWEENIPGLSYSKIVELAQQATPFLAWIDPDDQRFFQPGDMPARICDYLKQTGQAEVSVDDIGQIARIVYESLSMKYRYIFARITQTCGKTIDVLHITGGGSNNKMLNQFTANAMGIEVVAGPSECSAMGNILMQAYGRKAATDLSHIRQIVRNSVELDHYFPENSAAWNVAYSAFLAIISAV